MRKSPFVLLVVFTCAIACGDAKTPAKTPDQTEPAAAPAAEPAPGVTSEECAAAGGSVVGDIGDGAIHRPDYRCANGAKPTRIRAREGGPMAVEGEVCCPK